MTDHIRLKNGRGIYANKTILGLPWYGDDLVVTHGYDGTVDESDPYEEMMGRGFTIDERREIAEHMIKRWQEWGGIK